MYYHYILEPSELRRKHVVEMPVSNLNCTQIKSILTFSFSFPPLIAVAVSTWEGPEVGGWGCWMDRISVLDHKHLPSAPLR